MTDREEIVAMVESILEEFPGKENDPNFLELTAEEVSAGKDPGVPAPDRSMVAAELRRRALLRRN